MIFVKQQFKNLNAIVILLNLFVSTVRMIVAISNETYNTCNFVIRAFGWR